MTDNNRNKLNLGVKFLTKALHFKPEQIIITGSIALDLQGILSRDAHDLDFLLKMDDQTFRNLKFLECVFKDDSSIYYPECEMITFKVKGVNINIWKANEREIVLKDSETGIWVSPVKNILDAKKSYGRSKDLKDITDICKEILG